MCVGMVATIIWRPTVGSTCCSLKSYVHIPLRYRYFCLFVLFCCGTFLLYEDFLSNLFTFNKRQIHVGLFDRNNKNLNV